MQGNIIIRILYTECAKTKKNNSGSKRLRPEALIRRCDDWPATITHVPVAAVPVLNTPDDGRLRPKHVQWLCRNKTCTVLHQVGVSFDWFNVNYPLFVSNFHKSWDFLEQIFVQYPNIKISLKKKIRPVGTESFHMDGRTRTEEHDEVKKRICERA